MADTFVPLSDSTNPTGATACPQGQAYSAILQRCMSREDYRQAIAALAQTANPQQAFNLQQEALQNGLVQETNPVNALLTGNWKSLAGTLLPVGIGLVGLILVFLALSAWVNAKSISIAGQDIPLPKVL